MTGSFCRALPLVKIVLGTCSAAGVGTLVYALENSLTVDAFELVVHPVKLPWSHNGLHNSLDIASVRRGWEVYKQVCAACHSMRYLHFRHFVDAFMTEEEAKREAAQFTIRDINDDGETIERERRITDNLCSPYPNNKAAAVANNGIVPPDLSLMAWARKGNEDYLFSLMNGYTDPPAGVKVGDGKAYNPYFPGGIIGMPKQLFDEGIEYSDGTIATESQQAKDVCTFMRWAAEPFHDTRKRLGLKIASSIPFIAFVLIYAKRKAWTFIESQKFVFKTVKGRERPGTK
uniref:Cytochrome c domain-containing protein n=1 Tax=Syphacia muris TaxID=451379 RepID=A0A0N5AVM5_9BILA